MAAVRYLPLAVLGAVLVVHAWLVLVVLREPRLALALLPLAGLAGWAAARMR